MGCGTWKRAMEGRQPYLMGEAAISQGQGVPVAQDCEFTYLSTQILHLLGLEGPKTKDPAKYIRYIYNRIILENATVRAAAVSSLAKFGAAVTDLQPRINVLLKRALHDNDDEVSCLTSPPFVDICVHVSMHVCPYPSLCARACPCICVHVSCFPSC
jgi:hypothetical protein